VSKKFTGSARNAAVKRERKLEEERKERRKKDARSKSGRVRYGKVTHLRRQGHTTHTKRKSKHGCLPLSIPAPTRDLKTLAAIRLSGRPCPVSSNQSYW